MKMKKGSLVTAPKSPEGDFLHAFGILDEESNTNFISQSEKGSPL
jgi:hypothetical protein